MSILNLKQKVEAHGRSEVTCLLKIEGNDNKFVSIGHDGYLRIWNANSSLKKDKDIYVGSAYLTTIKSKNNKYYLGQGAGTIVQLDQNFNVLRKKKFHNDCICSILFYQNSIISIGFDGKILEADLQSFQVTRSAQVDQFVNEAIMVNNKIFLGSNPGIIFNVQQFEIQQILNERIDTAAFFKNQVYVSSDNNGLVNLNKDWFSYLPCQFMLPIQQSQSLLFFSQDSVGLLKIEGESSKWKCNKLDVLGKGYNLKSGIYYENRIFVTGQDGSIYQFAFNEKQLI